ncbi:MAG: DUF1552 domain-containing protein [Planctomycetes bacterium]|nr:DUF1552 domain-containing protein [Planctomycetota bacterium]
MTQPSNFPHSPASRDGGVNRRTFLRGVGAAIALPAFQSLTPFRVLGAESSTSAVAVTATGAPLRSAFIFFPNGAIPGTWWPKQEGTDWELSPTLQPLTPHKEFVQVLGGLNHQHAEPGPDGAGDHARGGGTFLTGVRIRKSATDIRAGVSIDQVLAREIGQATRFPSLELSCDSVHRSGACDSGYACAYQFNLSWRSPTAPMTPEANPRLAFERLFGAGAPGQRQASLQRRQQEQRSILDFVREDARAMQRRLNPRDIDKLDQYLTSIREIETRIDQAERFQSVKDPGVETPAGIPANYAEYIELMYDMLALAFQSDATRVGTLLLAHDGSNRSFEDIGISEGHHDLTHHQERAEWIQKVSQIDLWYARHFAKFLDRLKNTVDVDGQSLLHNSMIVYGGGNADANRHTHSNLPIVLAGSGGGSLQGGRFVKHGGKPVSNLFLSLADRYGVKGLSSFGDSTGRLENI